jgi:hypothetical protein
MKQLAPTYRRSGHDLPNPGRVVSLYACGISGVRLTAAHKKTLTELVNVYHNLWQGPDAQPVQIKLADEQFAALITGLVAAGNNANPTNGRLQVSASDQADAIVRVPRRKARRTNDRRQV